MSNNTKKFYGKQKIIFAPVLRHLDGYDDRLGMDRGISIKCLFSVLEADPNIDEGLTVNCHTLAIKQYPHIWGFDGIEVEITRGSEDMLAEFVTRDNQDWYAYLSDGRVYLGGVEVDPPVIEDKPLPEITPISNHYDR